jgi:hypothetical protein
VQRSPTQHKQFEKGIMTMPTREILRDQWTAFFQAFTDEHAGRLVSLGMDVVHSEHKIVDIEARERPLRQIAVDEDKENAIVISLGLSNGNLLRHTIQSVSHIRVAPTADGSDSVLEVETMNGQTTTLNLIVPV